MRNKVKRRALFSYLKEKAEIACIQETHQREEDEKEWELDWGETFFSSCGTGNARGVAILVKRNTDVQINNTFQDKEGRLCWNTLYGKG